VFAAPRPDGYQVQETVPYQEGTRDSVIYTHLETPGQSSKNHPVSIQRIHQVSHHTSKIEF
jgi:hypothetical protein